MCFRCISHFIVNCGKTVLKKMNNLKQNFSEQRGGVLSVWGL